MSHKRNSSSRDVAILERSNNIHTKAHTEYSHQAQMFYKRNSSSRDIALLETSNNIHTKVHIEHGHHTQANKSHPTIHQTENDIEAFHL
ncbi:hypothetical protein CDAR_240531 [Caerostris darwini]|uniref:Uncharacterized protein n=1 Tax=Caerostris darwini TaxID=1538125 RepID=A0AAV4PQQ2_9ARAC|nr:hypothetical protein CDAR_240531 [Caerostris darwini]